MVSKSKLMLPFLFVMILPILLCLALIIVIVSAMGMLRRLYSGWWPISRRRHLREVGKARAQGYEQGLRHGLDPPSLTVLKHSQPELEQFKALSEVANDILTSNGLPPGVFDGVNISPEARRQIEEILTKHQDLL